jgi:hypothetical protein
LHKLPNKTEKRFLIFGLVEVAAKYVGIWWQAPESCSRYNIRKLFAGFAVGNKNDLGVMPGQLRPEPQTMLIRLVGLRASMDD